MKERTEYEKDVNTLIKWADAYYSLDEPMATDEEYDKLYHKVLKFEKDHPDMVNIHSPTIKVGTESSNMFKKVWHKERMWSQKDIFDYGELEKWVNKMIEKHKVKSFIIEPKYDGLSLKLTYKDGVLIKAATRGNGLVGEDVLENVKYIRNIPLKIKYKWYIEVDGEVYMRNEDFNKLNELCSKRGDKLFANPRNAAAGTLRNSNKEVFKERRLYFGYWGMGAGKPKYINSRFKLYTNFISYMFVNYGLKRHYKDKLPGLALTTTYEQVKCHIDSTLDERSQIPFNIDGMVIKVDDIELSEEIGYATKYPKWSVAFKFPAVEKVTTVKDIIYQVGRTGVVTPVCILDEILIDGSMVERATLHNTSEVVKLDIRIGDKIILIKSGDIIPKITKILTDRRTGDEIPVVVPKNCPSCHSVLVNDGVFSKCVNSHCRERVMRHIMYFTDRQCMNILGLGEKLINKLYDKGLINKLTDIYKLTVEQLMTIDGVNEKGATKVYNAILKTHGTPLYRLLGSLGITDAAATTFKPLVDKYSSGVIYLSEEELLDNPGIGITTAKYIADYFKDNLSLVKELIDLVKPKIIKAKKDGKFFGKTFLLTGIMEGGKVKVIDYITENGGTVINTFNKKVDILIYGDKPGAKLEKAEKHNIPTIRYEDVYTMG